MSFIVIVERQNWIQTTTTDLTWQKSEGVVDLGKEHTASLLCLQVIYAILVHSLYIKIVQIPMNHGESEWLFSSELLILAGVSRGWDKIIDMKQKNEIFYHMLFLLFLDL